jgi:hypothetical protein
MPRVGRASRPRQSIRPNMALKSAQQRPGAVFQKFGVEGRNAATLRALEVLRRPSSVRRPPPDN